MASRWQLGKSRRHQLCSKSKVMIIQWLCLSSGTVQKYCKGLLNDPWSSETVFKGKCPATSLSSNLLTLCIHILNTHTHTRTRTRTRARTLTRTRTRIHARTHTYMSLQIHHIVNLFLSSLLSHFYLQNFNCMLYLPHIRLNQRKYIDCGL